MCIQQWQNNIYNGVVLINNKINFNQEKRIFTVRPGILFLSINTFMHMYNDKYYVCRRLSLFNMHSMAFMYTIQHNSHKIYFDITLLIK